MSTGTIKNHGLTLDDADRLLEAIVDFPGAVDQFERVQPITDFRKDDTEARVLYICRRIKPGNIVANGIGEKDGKDDLYILKCKVQ
jgi:hypothetical protein